MIGFLLLCGLLAYIVAGYPLLVAWIARNRPAPITDREERTVSIVVPVHNGAAFLAAKLGSILELDYPRERMEIVVVDDGSTDPTAEIAGEFASQGVRLLRQPKSGKAAALTQAIPQVSGEILVLTDVRQTLAPDSLRRLVACFADPAIGVVSADLAVRKGDREESSVGVYWRYEAWIRRSLGRIDSIFGATGPYYAMRRELAVPVPADILLDDVYLPLAAFFRGYRLIVEERARAWDYPTSVQTEFGRKVRTLAGNYQLLGHYPQLLTLRNRMLLHFLSYKLSRLLLPWIVVGILIASFWLPSGWREAALLAQAGFYGLAALDFVIPGASSIKRFTSAARTIVSMLAAAVLALRVFFVPPQQLWKPTQVRTDTNR